LLKRTDFQADSGVPLMAGYPVHTTSFQLTRVIKKNQNSFLFLQRRLFQKALLTLIFQYRQYTRQSFRNYTVFLKFFYRCKVLFYKHLLLHLKFSPFFAKVFYNFRAFAWKKPRFFSLPFTYTPHNN